MKVCTITCQNADNHGARLQAYALSRYLRMQGHSVEVIDYRPDYMCFRIRLWYWPGLSVKGWAKLVLQWRQRLTAIRRHKAFDAFSARHILLTGRRYASVEELRDNPPVADVYIAGSDQIWNTLFPNGTDAAYYLDFGSKGVRRISYAASFATRSLANGSERFVGERLQAFDAIGVRETSGLELLSSLGYNGRVVVDPVFLLTENDWDEIVVTPDDKQPYILVYDFMKSDVVRRVAVRLAKLHGCRIYSVAPYRLGYADKNFIYAAPEEFIGLIKNAVCVVSNSFHGTAFALIYHRNFFVVRRPDGLNDRMEDLLGRLGLSSRLIDAGVSDAVLKEDISFHCVGNMIRRQINDSMEYLNGNL